MTLIESKTIDTMKMTENTMDDAVIGRCREAIADTLKCSVCLDLYDDPLILSGCGHTFCRECITKHLQGRKAYSSQCPECKKPARERDCLPAHRLAAVVQAFKSAM